MNTQLNPQIFRIASLKSSVIILGELAESTSNEYQQTVIKSNVATIEWVIGELTSKGGL